MFLTQPLHYTKTVQRLGPGTMTTPIAPLQRLNQYGWTKLDRQRWARVHRFARPFTQTVGLVCLLLPLGGWSGPLAGAIAAPIPDSMPDHIAQLTYEELDDVEYWRNLCRLQTDAGLLAEALTACEQGLALEPEDSDLWALHSEILLQQETYADAIASATQALNFNPENSLALANQCVALFALEQTETALDRCNEALRLNGSWGDRSPVVAWRYRGRLLNQQGDYDQALTAYDRTLLLEPEDSLTLVYRCEVLVNLTDYRAAIASCEQALAGNGNWGNENPALAWQLQGTAQRLLSQYDWAIFAYDQAISLDPNNLISWTEQANVLETIDRPEEALTSYTQAVALQPDHSRALVGQCGLLNQLEQYEAALEACEGAIAGDGQWWDFGVAQAWNQKGVALAGLGQLEESLAAANRSVGILPSYTAAWNNRAVVLWYLQRYDEALASTRRAIDLDATYARPWATRGTIRRALGQYDLALEAYERSLQLDPDVPSVWANRSLVLWLLADYETAVLSANRAINLDPASFPGWYNRAIALMTLDRYPEALESYEQAVTLVPTNADAWTGLGVVLIQLEEFDRAAAALQQALAINSEQELAIAVMNELQNYQNQGSD
ncbi:MAG: tetratricopeptide repeat protein [Cyanothece sp. SIO2G6]|nr:tetratricopeptide repeat protein [Cyanothece sp. SIO2G6]